MSEGESLALVAFKRMLETEQGSLYIDPTSLGFFNEAGQGDFVVVEKGYWTPPGQCTIVVCIKSFKPGVIKTAEDVQGIVDGTKALLPVSHRCLSRTLGVGCYNTETTFDIRSSIFLVEEWAGCTTLNKAIRNSIRLPALPHLFYEMEDGLRWCLEIAEALQALHDNGIVHADIKLENIMLAEADTGQITDSMAVLVDIKPFQNIFLDSCNKALERGSQAHDHEEHESIRTIRAYKQRTLSSYAESSLKKENSAPHNTEPSTQKEVFGSHGSVHVCQNLPSGSIWASKIASERSSSRQSLDVPRPKGKFPKLTRFSAGQEGASSSSQSTQRSKMGRQSVQLSGLKCSSVTFSNEGSYGGAAKRLASVTRAMEGPSPRSTDREAAREEFRALWEEAMGCPARELSGIPKHRLSFVHSAPTGPQCGAHTLSWSESITAARSRWVDKGRMWRRRSWDIADADILSVASLTRERRSEGEYNSLIEEAAEDVARARAAGPGHLAKLIRGLNTDMELLFATPSEALSIADHVEEGGQNMDGSTRFGDPPRHNANLGRPGLKSSLKRVSSVGMIHDSPKLRDGSSSGFGCLSNGVLQDLGCKTSYPLSHSQVEIMSHSSINVSLRKKVRFTLPVTEAGEATHRDFSLLYRAPELWGSNEFKPSQATDVYTLAVLFYEVLMRMVICPEDVTQQGLEAYHKKVSEGVRESFPVLWPSEVKDLISAAWAQDPAERLHISDVVAQLRAMQGNLRLLTCLVYPNGTMPQEPPCCTVC